MGGAYTLRGSQVTFEQIVSTMMACSEPLMQQESAVFSMLVGTVTFKIEGSTLTIYDKGGANALRFAAEVGQ
jgi:heat shock protein HslJ